MALYSHSKLSTFEQCKLKYRYKYIDKIPETKKFIESFLGKCVHSALEWLYKLKIEEGKTATIDEIIVYFTELWREGFSPDFLIVKSHLTDKSYFEMGVRFLLDYYIKHQPFNDNTLALEKKVYIEMDSQGEYKLIGFIDRFVYNLNKDRYEIHDYKTSNYLPEQEKMDNDRQLALYSIGIKNEFGNKPVRLIWHYLAHNQEIHSERTDEQLDELKKEIIKLIKEIESSDDFSHNKSALCDWCEYRNICPAWGNSPEKIGKDDKIDKYPTLKKYLKE